MTEFHSTASPTRTKTAVRGAASPRGSAFGWPEVLRGLQDDDARSVALSLYRSRGFTPDDFAHRREARAAMADALSRAEDQIELRRQSPARDQARALVRAARRRLEAQLWP